MKNKNALSEIVVSVIMIAIVMSLMVIVWGVSTNLIGERLEKSSSCFGNFDQVTINKRYTCYNFSSDEIQGSLSVWNADIEGILVSVSGQSGTRSFDIKSGSSYSYVKTLNGNYNDLLNPPEKNSGVTYVINAGEIGIKDADAIIIAPIIDGNQCEATDSVQNLGNCALLN